MNEKPEYSIDLLAEHLTECRDRHQAAYDKYEDARDLGYVGGFKLALSLLKIHTNGDYGQSLAEQVEAAKTATAEVSE